MPLEMVQQYLVPLLHVFACIVAIDQRKHLYLLIPLPNMLECPYDDIGIFADPEWVECSGDKAVIEFLNKRLRIF